ncbi:uncharacterized protein PAC_04800 [Phialocephala subalpina]|uniref:Zn(2)-C6 fungal-type domain-containing protein n=1 Tax=Phialocephala subalpina TaxID=576137 RepID=A0A1L7WQ72_9HELO|nr:uncharacterized protein PAC_04800 [Phialocephala subalpina]
MPLEEVRKGRAGKPKVRTGCKTCKRRRIKCDERRPGCLRCEKFGVECDGYQANIDPPQRRPKRDPLLPQKRALLPKDQCLIARLPQSQHLSQEPSLMPALDGPNDHQYFQFFREKSFHEFGDLPWMQVMLQSSHNQPTIQYLISSVSALCRATSLKYKRTPEYQAQHLQHAYRRYGQAVQGIRYLASTSGLESARTLLQASLLIYIFEMLQGNIPAAIRHLQSTFRNLIVDRLPDKGLFPYTHLEPITQYQCMDSELVTSFARLDVQLCTHPDSPPNFQSRSTILGIAYSTNPYSMPGSFPDIATARRYIEDLIQRARAGLPTNLVRHLQNGSVPSSPIAAAYRNKHWLSDEEVDHLHTQLSQWQAAFSPFYKRSLTPEGTHDFIRVSILCVQASNTSLVLSKFRPQDPNTDPLLQPPSSRERDACIEIIDMCRRAARHEDFIKGFVVHEGFLRSLFIVGLLTREEDTKYEVLGVLEEMSGRREGIWDAEVVRIAVKDSLRDLQESRILEDGLKFEDGYNEYETYDDEWSGSSTN